MWLVAVHGARKFSPASSSNSEERTLPTVCGTSCFRCSQGLFGFLNCFSPAAQRLQSRSLSPPRCAHSSIPALNPTALVHSARNVIWTDMIVAGRASSLDTRSRVIRQLKFSEPRRKVRALMSGPVRYPCNTQDVQFLPHVCLLSTEELYLLKSAMNLLQLVLGLFAARSI
ncbi:hypothetical protein V5799_021216 [Amblyomma americanum]|uniref:Uncharacterized protein n=1 Tax=Amblyomma americanum TaxID=6943 RepID=A0AAQ4FNT2_AMBAM